MHNDNREVWHANIGPIDTPQLLALHDALEEIVESNRQDGDKTKPAALVDAYPGLGKSTAVRDYGRKLFRKQVALRGETTPSGDRRVPVIYIALSGNTQIQGPERRNLPLLRADRRPGTPTPWPSGPWTLCCP